MSSQPQELNSPGARQYQFGPFLLDPPERRLFRDEAPVPLPPKAFDTLVYLVENPGHLISKDDLMKAVWRDTFVEESNLTLNISILRKALGDSPQEQRFIVTVPGRGYRFNAPVRAIRGDATNEVVIATHGVSKVTIDSAPESRTVGIRQTFWLTIAAGAILLALGTAAFSLWHSRHQHRLTETALTETDTLVLGEIENRTGDPVFDDTLRQALAIQLEQSPYLSVVSDQQIRKVLPLAGHGPNDRLSPEVTRNVCARTDSKAMITGVISALGTAYVVDLNAVACASGDLLAREQVQASRKEEVLKRIGDATTDLRSRLGESVHSINKFNTPIHEATTPSLDALKSYSTAVLTMINDDPRAAIPLYERAIELDPNFAMAYLALGGAYSNIGEYKRSNDYTVRAYKLRDRVSEPEKFAITATYENDVLGDLDAGNRTLQVWSKTYPRAPLAHVFLDNNYFWIGMYEQALAEAQAAVRQTPVPDGIAYGNLMQSYMWLNRISEAKAVYGEAKAHGIDNNYLRTNLYLIAFLEHDSAAMKAQLEWSHGKPGEDFFIGAQADTEAIEGHLLKARELTDAAVQLARQGGQVEAAAQWRLLGALRDAEFGDARVAAEEADEALKLAGTREVRTLAALAFARAGQLSRANSIAAELAKDFPQDTLLHHYWLPSIHAAIALHASKPDQALKDLEATERYELGTPSLVYVSTMYPVYLRGQAYLMMHSGKEAEAEFQKILERPFISVNFATGVLARLGLARSYSLQGESEKARSTYTEFLQLLVRGDRSLAPIRQARFEMERL